MKRTTFSSVSIAMALAAGGHALAEAPEDHEMLAMIEFIAQNSSLEYHGQDLPEVTVVTENELQLLFRSAQVEVFANQDPRSFARVSALYDRSLKKIFLADVNAIEESSLLHELVHFLQDINDEEDAFASRRVCLEAEAYDLQALWQTEQGIDLASTPDYGFVMTLYGVCNDADFSWVDSAKSD